MGWRELLPSAPPRKERKYGKTNDSSPANIPPHPSGCAAQEISRQHVLAAMFVDNANINYAVAVDSQDTYPITVTLGIREANGSIVTCDLLIPRAKYDPHLLSALLKQYDGTIQ